jgi:hypothetical protein
MSTTTRFCTNCGAHASDERFCTGCGAALDHDAFAGTSPTSAPDNAVEVGPEHSSASGATAVGTRQAAGTPPDAASRPVRPTVSRSPLKAITASAVFVVVAIAVAVIVLISTGDKPAAQARKLGVQRAQLTDELLASRQLYASTQQRSYSALLPAGWRQIAASDPNLTGAVTVRSPVDAGATITVGQVAKPTKSLRAEAAALRKSARGQNGVTRLASASYRLPGNRLGWTVAYSSGGRSVAYYLVSSCSRMFAVSASVPSSRVALVRARVQIVAGTLQGDC